jgi:hypothetical protein
MTRRRELRCHTKNAALRISIDCSLNRERIFDSSIKIDCNSWWFRRYPFLNLYDSEERRMSSIVMLHSNQIYMFGDVVDINVDSFLMRFIPIEPEVISYCSKYLELVIR